MISAQQPRKKTRQFVFLLVLVGFVAIITFVSASYRSQRLGTTNIDPKGQQVLDSDEPSSEVNGEAPIAQQVELEPEIYKRETESPFTNDDYIDTQFELMDDGGFVLGAEVVAGCDETSGERCVSELIGYQPVCSEAEVSMSYAGDGSSAGESGSGFTVSKNAAIEIWKVTSPLPILSGSEAIDTTGYEISDEFPNFNSGVKMVRQSLVGAKYVAPGDEKHDLIAAEAGADDDDWSIHAQLAWGDGGGSEETIYKELESICPDIQPSDPNPDKSNKVAQEVMNAYATPGNPLEPRNYEFPGCLKAPGVDLPEADVFETCAIQRGVAAGTVVQDLFVQATKWAECIVAPQNCTQQEVVGLLIDAPYGANHICNEGFCADQFFDHHTASNVPPGELAPLVDGIGDPDDPTIIPHYVTTPCKIKVVDNVHNGIYDVPCIWDLSPYKARYEAQAAIREPADPEFPSWDEYWAMVMVEAKRRGEICEL